MTFVESVRTCFTKYADFSGRASRSEFWWWVLFCVIATMALGAISHKLEAAFTIATLLPALAVGARRLHDTDRSGWLQLLGLVPIIGWIVLIVWCAQEAKEPNRFGAVPVRGA
jgi:uncharacterized membrane protein YhaH (DUF805 family)